MRSKLRALLLWSFFGMIVLLTAIQVRLGLASGLFEPNPLLIAAATIYSLIPIVLAGVGSLILSRQPHNRIGWLTLALAILVFLDTFVSAYLSHFTEVPSNPSLTFYLAAWYTGAGWVLSPVTIFFIVLFFPTGRAPTRRWRWVAALGLGIVIYTVVVNLIGRGWQLFGTDLAIPNPLELLPEANLPDTDIRLYELPLPLLPIIFALPCVLSLVVRYRQAGIVERKQIKWLLFAGSLFVLILPLTFVLYLLELENIGRDLANLLFTLGTLAFPVAIGIAILRYNLFDIDLIIRKTLIYTILTALLGLVYVGVVILLQSVFEAVSGQQSAISIVVSTLIIAALFAPLRRRVQEFIDRRFYRRRYDAEQTLTAFGQFVRDETDMEALTAELLRVTEETMLPETVAVWLKESHS